MSVLTRTAPLPLWPVFQSRFLKQKPCHIKKVVRAVLNSCDGNSQFARLLTLETVYDNGETIYDGACQPCHGTAGHGDGPVAGRLLVPAADLAAIRADREYIYGILKDGTPGSAMPYFRLYDKEKLDKVLDTLSTRFSMFAAATKPAHEPDLEAQTVWEETCSVCHGTDGAPTPFGRTLRPEPPDLRRFSLTPERALTIITEGYPGTVMQPYRALPEEVRRDLVAIGNSFRIVPDSK